MDQVWDLRFGAQWAADMGSSRLSNGGPKRVPCDSALTVCTSGSMSTGLERCSWNPAPNERRRSSSPARGVELPQVADEAVTVLARHRDVADDQLRVEFRHGASRLLRRPDRADLRARLPQHLLHRLAGRLIVVDDEGRAWAAHVRPPPRPACRVRPGAPWPHRGGGTESDVRPVTSSRVLT